MPEEEISAQFIGEVENGGMKVGVWDGERGRSVGESFPQDMSL